MKVRSVLATLACCVPLVAAAQWQWLDASGRKVFSDAPPPADVPQSRILRAPGGSPAAAEVAATPPAAPAAEPALPRVSGKDKDLEQKKKQAEAAEAEKKKAEEAKLAAARADNCERARRGKATLDSGVRIARSNAQGEREYMDDQQRAAEAQRLQAIITRDCTVAQ